MNMVVHLATQSHEKQVSFEKAIFSLDKLSTKGLWKAQGGMSSSRKWKCLYSGDRSELEIVSKLGLQDGS